MRPEDPNNPEGYVIQRDLDQRFEDENRLKQYFSSNEGTKKYIGKCPFCGAEIKEESMFTNITATFEFNGQFICAKCQQFVIVGIFGSKEEALQNIKLAVRLFDKGQAE